MEEPLPSYLVSRTRNPLVVDGRLDEASWHLAPQVNGFRRILSLYGQVERPTRARMLWDDEHLYFAFACQDPDIWAVYEQEDDEMWSEEVVEVFIDPDGDGRNYLELEVNPLNAWVDLRILGLDPEWEASRDWDIRGLKTGVQVLGSVNDTADVDVGWTCEIAIPWSAMADSIGGGGRPRPGDVWRLNLYRIERKAGRQARLETAADARRLQPLLERRRSLLQAADLRDAEGADLSALPELLEVSSEIELLRKDIDPRSRAYEEATEYTAWSETYQRGFHHPARFGLVQFGE